jgi:hypothetical protein
MNRIIVPDQVIPDSALSDCFRSPLTMFLETLKSSLPVTLLFVVLFAGGCSMQRRFDHPQQAVDSLVNSLRAGDTEELKQILGSNGEEILFSGDPVNDEANTGRFLSAFDTKNQLVFTEDDTAFLHVGEDEWPLPIPIVRDDFSKRWIFDTEAGKDEILSRRIGRNELDTMQVCLAVVDAQREYAALNPERAGVPIYAEKIFSDPGRKNGLYWIAAEGEPPSPLGPLAAEAAAEGYSRADSRGSDALRPYHGYYFKLLKSQGPSAIGGARDYIVQGRLLGGFAVVAWPATYGTSGIKSFMINQDGVLYQCDLGEDTAKRAPQISSFDPGPKWERVDPAEYADRE